MLIGNHVFDFDRKGYIMGILNVTPDSFSDGGRFSEIDSALFHVEDMIRQGADIIDVGGESTRPGYTPVAVAEEIDRVVPVIEAVSKRFDIPLSIDTMKADVAREAVRAGACMINDIWGLKKDPDMAGTVADTGAVCCLMHNRLNHFYKDFLPDFCEDVEESLRIARKAGIAEDKILLDPGVGFGKDYGQNMEIIRHLDIMERWDKPILLGVSRKSVIGLTLDLPVDQRMEGTLALTAFGRMKKASLFRVHDVCENRRVLDMIDALMNG